ncbi:hypothetical protein, partial [Nonomuraea sp. NPDC049784]|uniref:hypothetical protein n=1 Tax=Nonomuraea sp. NPDC049784 TaxID=3154361 RepID=UPI0033CFCECF
MIDTASPFDRHPVLDLPSQVFVDRHVCPPSAVGPDPDLERARRALADLQGGDRLPEDAATSAEWFALPGGPT